MYPGASPHWLASDRLPPCTLRMALTHLLDITTPPTPPLLQQLAALAADKGQAERLTTLSEVISNTHTALPSHCLIVSFLNVETIWK